jgi:hypothetical protein
MTTEAHRRGSDLHPKVARRIRISGVLLLLGMAVEVISLMWSNPTAFLVFSSVGFFFFAAGLGFYLFSLVVVRWNPVPHDDRPPSV